MVGVVAYSGVHATRRAFRERDLDGEREQLGHRKPAGTERRRPGQATSTVTPVSATSTTDGPLVNGTTYRYRLSAYSGTRTSPAVTATLTPSC